MLFPFLKAMAMFCVFVNPLSHTYKYCMFIFVPRVLTNKFCLGSSLISASYSTSFSCCLQELPQLSSPSISLYQTLSCHTNPPSKVFKINLLHLTLHLDCYTCLPLIHTHVICLASPDFHSSSLQNIPPTL